MIREKAIEGTRSCMKSPFSTGGIGREQIAAPTPARRLHPGYWTRLRLLSGGSTTLDDIVGGCDILLPSPFQGEGWGEGRAYGVKHVNSRRLRGDFRESAVFWGERSTLTPTHPNPLPRREREPEAPSDRGVNHRNIERPRDIHHPVTIHNGMTTGRIADAG